jgi:hypothetical protein
MKQRDLSMALERSLRLCAEAEARGLAVLSQTDFYGRAALEPERWEEMLEHITDAHMRCQRIMGRLVA